MNCHNCGERLEGIITDLPFKIQSGSIIIIKKLPVMQCKNCSEYVIEDSVMERVDSMLNKIDKAVELEIFSYAM